jgi:asparagine synthase (glutamine-hydrolysing)
MLGIAGIIQLQRGKSESRALAAMLRAMQLDLSAKGESQSHEGLGLSVGFVCSPSSQLCSVWNESKDIGLVFCGEPFTNAQELDGLSRGGSKYQWLVRLYEKERLRFLEVLNGWFSGVLLDLRQQRVILFNDRFGLQRIYYHQSDTGFYFASQAKALLEVLPDLRCLDMTGFAELVTCGCPLQNRTIFKGVSLLPGGSSWIFQPNKPVQKEQYFKPETWESQPPLDEERYYQSLRATFMRALPRCFRGEQTIGMSLTGGLDGRMIMAWAAKAPGTLPCYTFGGSYRDCFDVRLARKVAQICRQPHQVIPVNGEFLSEFPSLVEQAIRVSDGAMDVTGSVELYVNRFAREVAPVRLTGNYGSEIIRGSVAFKPSPLNEAVYSDDFLRLSGEAAGTYAVEKRCHPVSFIAFKQVPWFHYARLSVEQSLVTPRSPYLDNELVSLMYRAPVAQVVNKEPSLRLISEGNAALARLPTDRGLRHRPVPVISRLHNLWQEFTVRTEYAYDYGMPQSLARIDRVFAPLHFERLFLGRHKFYHFRVWYRDKLAGYVKEVLLDGRSRSRPHIRGKELEELVNRHVSGRANHTLELHQLLSLELIHRQLIERN